MVRMTIDHHRNEPKYDIMQRMITLDYQLIQFPMLEHSEKLLGQNRKFESLKQKQYVLAPYHLAVALTNTINLNFLIKMTNGSVIRHLSVFFCFSSIFL
jgi:hypothetical protein